MCRSSGATIGTSGPTSSRICAISGPSPSGPCSSAIAPWIPSSTPSTGNARRIPSRISRAERLVRLARDAPAGDGMRVEGRDQLDTVRLGLGDDPAVDRPGPAQAQDPLAALDPARTLLRNRPASSAPTGTCWSPGRSPRSRSESASGTSPSAVVDLRWMTAPLSYRRLVRRAGWAIGGTIDAARRNIAIGGPVESPPRERSIRPRSCGCTAKEHTDAHLPRRRHDPHQRQDPDRR